MNVCQQSIKHFTITLIKPEAVNSKFKTKCVKYDEPQKRWLVNWRNIHYFEFPNEGVVTFTEKDYDKIMNLDEIFIRKVRSKISDKLLDLIDEATK